MMHASADDLASGDLASGKRLPPEECPSWYIMCFVWPAMMPDPDAADPMHSTVLYLLSTNRRSCTCMHSLVTKLYGISREGCQKCEDATLSISYYGKYHTCRQPHRISSFSPSESLGLLLRKMPRSSDATLAKLLFSSKACIQQKTNCHN